MHPHEFLRHYPHEWMIQQAYEDMELASPKPTYGKGSSPKQNIIENAMAILNFPEFKIFSKKDYVRYVWNEGHNNEDLLSIHPRKGIDKGMKKVIKTWGKVLRNPAIAAVTKKVPRFLYHGSPVGGLKVLKPRVDPVLDATMDGQSHPLLFLSEEPFEVEWYALGGYQAGQDYLRSQGVTRFTQLNKKQSKQFRAIIRDAWENPIPGYIYKVETTGKDIERIDASFENRAYISKEPMKVIESQRITEYTMENPILPRDYIKAMDEGWTGFPTWSISPTISAHDLKGNPPRPIPKFGYHFTSPNNMESIRVHGLRAPVYLFYPDSNYHAWVLSGQIDGVFEDDNPDMAAEEMRKLMFDLIMLRVRFDKSEFVPAPYETGDVHDEFYLNSDVSPEDIAIEGTFAETVGYDLMTGAYTPRNIGQVPNMKAIVEGYFAGDPDHLRPNPPGIPKESSELSIERKKEIRKKWKELVNMTATELQTFYDSDLGNKKAGLSREEAQEAGISSGRDSALAIIKMKQTPVKEWHKRHSKDRGRGIMLDFWQWAQKQINFNTRHRGMRGPYLDEKGRPTRKLLGLWIWGHDPWRYALKVKKERLPKCPNVPWVGSKEKKEYGVLPKENPVFKVILGDIVTISGPSSSGKSTIAKALSKKLRARMVPSYMTREPRPSEEQGVDGIFVSTERFEDMIASGDFTTKEGVDLWVRQKNGEFYGRKTTDFMGSKPAIVDVNFEGLRLMRKAFPDRIYSVFIRTNMGPKRRRENLEKRGVHTQKEIESRVRAGTGMLETFQNMNFDFIARNKYGELEKNVAMIASEFNKWGGKTPPKAISIAKANPIQTLKRGTELLHKPTGMKYTFIEPRIDDDGTWYILKDIDGGLSNVLYEDLQQFYSLYPKSPLYIANPANQDQEEIVRRFIQSLDPSIEFDAKALELRLQNAGYKRYPNSRQIGRMLKKIHEDGLIVKTSFSGASSYRNSERNFALDNPPIGLRAIIEASISKRALLHVIEKANKALQRPKRPKRAEAPTLTAYEKRMNRYNQELKRYKHRIKKIEKYYGYSGTSGKSLVSKVIDAIEKEFKGKPTLTAYRAIFAFKTDEPSIRKWITTFGTGDYYSTWKKGADIYFGEFNKAQNWAEVPGAVAWLITSEINILGISWVRTLRNRIDYPEEKELCVLPDAPKPISLIVKRVDVYDLNQSAKYAKSDSTGVKHQPWLSNKIKPIAGFELLGLRPRPLKANPPVFDGVGAMDMGFQHEGKTRYHGHPLPGGTEIPDISGKWKKKSFPSGSEMPLRSKQEADGTYTMGFLERFEDDDRPYIVSNKIDGDSSIAHFNGKETVLWNKRGRWRKDFHLTEQITASLQENGVKSAIILGELYAVDEKGDILPLKEQTRHITAPKDIEAQNRARFAAYDMAQINGKDVQDEPYASRMEILKPLIRGSAVKVVQSWRSRGGMGDILLAWNEVSKNPHFEGLVVRFDGDKKSFKVKMTGTADLAVIGFYRGKAGGRDENTIGGGTLAWMDEDGNYVVAGNSVIGESIVEKDELLKRLLPTAIDAPKVKWGDHMVDRSITHDHRGKSTITAVEPFLIGEFKYRSINYSEKPVYRLEGGRFVQVGTKRAPTLFQASFGRWRPDKELTPHDLRMGQVAAEGQGKWKENPWKSDSRGGYWGADEIGLQIFQNSSSLQFIKEQLVGEPTISRRDVFNMVAEGVERKYGVRYEVVSEQQAKQIPYLHSIQNAIAERERPLVPGRYHYEENGDKVGFFDGRNYGTWDEKNGVVYFNERMFENRVNTLQELGHETGAVVIASQFGGKEAIPKVDDTAPNKKTWLTHLVDKYTFGRIKSNPPDDDDTEYPGGTAQYLMDGLLLGSLKERMGDWRTGGISNMVTRKNWALEYPELAARLEEAQKRGWSYTGPPLPKMKENPKNPTEDEIHQKTLDETGFWGAQGAGAIVMARSTGRFLLPLRSQHVEQPGTWGVWGGAIDANEVPSTAAKREIAEEAGYEGEIEIVPLVVFESGSFRYHNHLAIVEEEFTPKLNWESERAEWFEFKDFPQPLHFGLLYMLENSTYLVDDKYWLANPAPGYQSYGWTTQDWRSIKVNNKGEIDYSEKCGAEGTQTASGKPRLCLPAIVVKSLIRTESGKEVIRKQARKKARAKKGERIPWHPRIKKLWKKLEEKTVKDRPKSNPPATDIEWTTKISSELPENNEWLFGTWEGGQAPSVVFGPGGERVVFRRKKEIISNWILLSGKNADGEIKVILSVFEDLKGLADLYHSGGWRVHKTKSENLGFDALAMVEQIETKTKGKGLGQAAYLKAAEVVSKKFRGVIATGNHSLDAEKAWRGVEKHLPEGYEIDKWIGGEYPEWEAEDPFNYHRLLWYDGPKSNPLRGTSAKHFDQSMSEGFFEPRMGGGAYKGYTAVWAAIDESPFMTAYESATMAFDYSTTGKGSFDDTPKDRVPLVHYISPTADMEKQTVRIVRYPNGFKAEDTIEVWRGQTFNDWASQRTGFFQKLRDRLGSITDNEFEWHKYKRYKQEQRKSFDQAFDKFRRERQPNPPATKNKPKKNGVLPVKHGGRFTSPSYVHDDPSGIEEELHNERKQSRDDYDESVKAYMRKNLNRLWKWDTNFKEGTDGVKEKAMLKKAKAHAKKEVGTPKSCNIDCLYCAREQWKKNPSPLMRIPKIVLADMITPRMLDSKSQIFLFGDNEQRKGKGGQAKVMRGHAKAYGIRTKRAPSMSESAFWTDKTYKSNIKMMADDFLAAFMAASDGDHELVIPSAGIGTGMAQLKQRAPKTYKWLNSFLRNLIAGEDPALLKQWRMN